MSEEEEESLSESFFFVPPLPDDYKATSQWMLPKFMVVPGFETISLLFVGLMTSASGASCRFLLIDEKLASSEIKDMELSTLLRNVRAVNMSKHLLSMQSLILNEDATELSPRLHDRNENLLETLSNGLQSCCGLTIIKQDSLDIHAIEEELQDNSLDYGVLVLVEGVETDYVPRFLGPFFFGGKHARSSQIERGYARLSWAVGSMDGVMTLFLPVRGLKNGKVRDYVCYISDGNVETKNLGEDDEHLADCSVRFYAICFEYNETAYFPDETYNARATVSKPTFRHEVDLCYSEFLKAQMVEWDKIQNWEFFDYVCQCLRFPEFFVLGMQNNFDLALAVGIGFHCSGEVDGVINTNIHQTVSTSITETQFTTAVRDYAAFTEWLYTVIALAKGEGESQDLIEYVDKFFAFLPLENQRLIALAMDFLYEVSRKCPATQDRIGHNVKGILEQESVCDYGLGGSVTISFDLEFGGSCNVHTETFNPRTMIRRLQQIKASFGNFRTRMKNIMFREDYKSYRQRTYNNFAITF